MKAMELRDWNADSIVLAERPKPTRGPGQVLIKMQAASLNYRDTVMAKRGYGRWTDPLRDREATGSHQRGGRKARGEEAGRHPKNYATE